MQIELNQVNFGYAGQPQNLFEQLNLRLSGHWIALVGDNGAGKSTLAKLIAGELKPTSGSIRKNFDSYCYLPQGTDIDGSELEAFAYDFSSESAQLMSRLAIDYEWLWRYESLSFGQQKRIQLALCLAKRSEVLILDEPTNHLDHYTKSLIYQVLQSYEGDGILISHDLKLLNLISDSTLFVAKQKLTLYPGNYDKAQALYQEEQASLAHDRQSGQRELRRLAAEREARRQKAARADSLRSKRHIDPKDKDAKSRIDLAIYTGKDGVAGHLSKTLDKRLKSLEDKLEGIYLDKRYSGSLPDFGARSKKTSLAHLEEGLLYFDEKAPEAGGVKLPELFLDPAAHIAIVGNNGLGKSTILRALTAAIVPDTSYLYMPQELDAAAEEELFSKFAELDKAAKGQVLSVVAQLNSDPDAFVDAAALSPGEKRKLMLAMASLEDAELLLLDEPTNHLDLHSKEALAAFLGAFVGAAVVVSHDEAFVEAFARELWQLEAGEEAVAFKRVLAQS